MWTSNLPHVAMFLKPSKQNGVQQPRRLCRIAMSLVPMSRVQLERRESRKDAPERRYVLRQPSKLPIGLVTYAETHRSSIAMRHNCQRLLTSLPHILDTSDTIPFP